jgi:zinc protease
MASPLPSKVDVKPLHFEPARPERIALPGGPVIFLLQDRRVPAVSLTALFRAGSAEDPPDQAGLAELTAEAVRSGGAAGMVPAALEEALADLAVRIEQGTTRDLTRFDLWALASQAPRAVELLADLLQAPSFEARALRTARERRIEEARREEEEPHLVATREFNRALFGGHPYGCWADEESLSRIGRREVRGFHREHYRRSRLILAVSGDFERDPLLALLRRRFAEWPEPAGAPAAGATSAASAARAEGEGAAAGATQAVGAGTSAGPGGGAPAPPRIIERDLSQASMIIGHRGPRWDDPDLPALEVLAHILGYYRYYLEIRDNRGLAYVAEAGFSPGILAGALAGYAGTRAEQAGETLELMRRQLEEVAEGKFTDEEARGARESVTSGLVHRFGTAAETVREHALAEARGLPPGWLEAYGRRLAALTPEDLRRAARRHIRPAELQVVVVGPPGSAAAAVAK